MTSENNDNIGLIIVAAGSGKRAGGEIPKQYQNLAGIPVLKHTLNALLPYFPSKNIRVVINEDHREHYEAISSGLNLPEPVSGGATRQESVFNGLSAFETAALNETNLPDYVLIHDAARPFVNKEIIAGITERLHKGAKGVIPAIQIVDTLKYAEDGIINHTVPRDNLYKVQTPQGFVFKELLEAHKNEVNFEHTDDAAVMEANNWQMMLSKGHENNFKITTSDDFKKAEHMIMNRLSDIRVGSGFDVHRFEAGDTVTLCGIDIPFSQKLMGHSDADVGMHALTDAILSAIAAGDIGTHFPPSDEKWKGAPSETFLRHASNLVTERGGMISHAGITLICEAPKIGPHKDAMRARIADILNIDIDRVSVQATTTEKLGFTGRGEGIAAQASATVRLP